MRACVQRVSRAVVRVEEQVTGEIGRGLLVLLGVGRGDTPATAARMCDKIIDLRVFPDEAGKMNRALAEIGGGLLVVSQFTLYGDCRKGRRPSFVEAAEPELGNQLYEHFLAHARGRGVPTAAGRFRAEMQVELVNDGPVTLLMESDGLF